MKRVIFLCILTVLVASLLPPVAAQPPAFDLEKMRAALGDSLDIHIEQPLPPGLAGIANKIYSLSLYDTDTQKSFRTDKLCFFGDTDESLVGIWFSTKNPDIGGFWVQWGHEIWLWGTNLSTGLDQLSLIGRYFKGTEITGRFTIFDFDNPGFGAFRLKKAGGFGSKCDDS